MTPFIPKWVAIAETQIGTAEIFGDQSNPKIVEYHKATDGNLSSDEIPWCSSFANWVIQKAGLIGTRSQAARSWLKWGKAMDESNPPFGAIVVLKRGNSEWQGHVGFLVGIDADHVNILGGNQHDQVNISTFSRKDVLGYRWP